MANYSGIMGAFASAGGIKDEMKQQRSLANIAGQRVKDEAQDRLKEFIDFPIATELIHQAFADPHGKGTNPLLQPVRAFADELGGALPSLSARPEINALLDAVRII